MKTEQRLTFKFALGFAWIVIMLWGCKNDFNDTSRGILPSGDIVKVGKVIEKESIKAYTFNDGNIRTDESQFNLFGTFNDPIFGKTTADFACQFRLSKYPDFTTDDQADSLVLYLLYYEIYGDTITPQHIKVYELASDLDLDSKYYQDIDLKSLSKSQVLAELNYVPKFKLDSLGTSYGSTKADPKDTVVQEIAIKLDASLMNKLMAADTLTWSDNDVFMNYFKGLYVEAADISQGGTIMRISTLARGSSMALYYHNSVRDTSYVYNINSNSARVSRFKHDYTQTLFASHLSKEDSADSLIYLQSTGGLKTKILIPGLEGWRDSTNFAINQAELIFQMDSAYSDTTFLLPPEQLVFSAIGLDTAKVETEYLPSDVSFSSTYYGGIYNKTDKTYRFNIAKHMQEVIDGKKENLGFYLSTAFRSALFRRVVLKGATSKTGIRLEITYSKIK